MTPHLQPPLPLPDHWTPAQALAVFELIEQLRDQLWDAYGPDIQRATREDRITDQAPPTTESPF
jgi:hypothetical protein